MGRKTTHGRFKQLIHNISHDKTWTWLRKGNFKRETESLLIAAQNSTIRTNHIKARIDKTQQNSKCKLCGDRDETITHIISECNKLAQKEYKARHDWVGKVIHWEKCKKVPRLARELKKLWNVKVTIIPIVIGAFGTVTKGLLKGLEDLEVGNRVESPGDLRRLALPQSPVKDHQLTLM